MWKPRGQSAQPTPCPAGPAAGGELVTVDFSHQSAPLLQVRLKCRLLLHREGLLAGYELSFGASPWPRPRLLASPSPDSGVWSSVGRGQGQPGITNSETGFQKNPSTTRSRHTAQSSVGSAGCGPGGAFLWEERRLISE